MYTLQTGLPIDLNFCGIWRGFYKTTRPFWSFWHLQKSKFCFPQNYPLCYPKALNTGGPCPWENFPVSWRLSQSTPDWLNLVPILVIQNTIQLSTKSVAKNAHLESFLREISVIFSFSHNLHGQLNLFLVSRNCKPIDLPWHLWCKCLHQIVSCKVWVGND